MTDARDEVGVDRVDVETGTGAGAEAGARATEADVDAERRHLMRVAYRLLGTVADAEDAVQEAFARWYRLDPLERAAILVPGAWLTRVTGRICLDQLGSARARREHNVGEWLPEPVPAESDLATIDPLERAAITEDVGLALLVVLEAMTPAERVAFVLHDVFALPFAEIAEIVGRSSAACRQLATAARRRVRADRAARAPRERHNDLARAFAEACATGDLTALVSVLDPSVTLRSDGGGRVSAARRPVVGADAVARFVLGVLRKNPDVRIEPRATGDGTGFAWQRDGRTAGVLMLRTTAENVTDVWIQMNPAKLRSWDAR